MLACLIEKSFWCDITCLSKLGCLKEQLAARDKSWDAERQDLEQQLEARQGPRVVFLYVSFRLVVVFVD